MLIEPITTGINWLADGFSIAQGWLFETLVQPLVYHFELGEFTEQAFDATEWFLVGLCELIILFCLLRPLEAWIPVHRFTDRTARRNDFIYTALHRLGLFSILIFFMLDPLLNQIQAGLHYQGIHPFNLESLWPNMGPLPSFFLYLVVLDFFDYLYHRAEHRFNWWWGLHSLHHSQQNMNLWSDNRNHLFDDLLRDFYMGMLAIGLGVAPSQYVLLVSVSRCLQSLQHANVRLHFGYWGERLLVSPRYHRLHHSIGLGHESNGPGTLGGCNFAVLFPVWDILFCTADFRAGFASTGIRDQLPPPEGAGRNYGREFWQQQWYGILRMTGRSR